MDGMMLFKMGFLLTISFLRLLVAIPLFLTARRNNLTNLYWLSLQFLALVIAVPFAAIGAWDNRWIFWTFISVTEIALLMFIHTTFRRERSSWMPVLMTLTLIGMAGGIYGNLTNNFTLSAWMVYPHAALAWGWHLLEATRSYQQIGHDASTEDWVKARYQLMIVYALVDMIGAVLGTVSTTGSWNSDVLAMLVVLINITSVMIQILTWVMPEPFRRWLNRKQQTRTEEELRQKGLAIFNLVGSAMTQGTNIPKMLALFSLRKAIGAQLNTEDQRVIEQHASKINYDDWLKLLDNPDLYHLFELSSEKADTGKMIENARRALIENQSLLTMQAK